jgi:hypothetical protein
MTPQQEYIIEACISSGRYLNPTDVAIKLSDEDILKIEKVLYNYDDATAKIKIRKIIKESQL